MTRHIRLSVATRLFATLNVYCSISIVLTTGLITGLLAVDIRRAGGL